MKSSSENLTQMTNASALPLQRDPTRSWRGGNSPRPVPSYKSRRLTKKMWSDPLESGPWPNRHLFKWHASTSVYFILIHHWPFHLLPLSPSFPPSFSISLYRFFSLPRTQSLSRALWNAEKEMLYASQVSKWPDQVFHFGSGVCVMEEARHQSYHNILMA